MTLEEWVLFAILFGSAACCAGPIVEAVLEVLSETVDSIRYWHQEHEGE